MNLLKEGELFDRDINHITQILKGVERNYGES
jgi:hypothetical protein